MGDLRQVFSQLLAAHRRRTGLTQSDLAERAKLSVEMITKLEGGQTGASFPAIERLAEALQIDPAELFSTEVKSGAFQRRRLSELFAKLAALSESDAAWAVRLIELALARKP